MIVSDFFAAFQAGKELSNAATWKKAQVVVAKLSVLLGAVVAILGAFGYVVPLTTEQIGVLAGAVGIIVGMFNGTATVVSTSRVGLSPRGGSVTPSGDDGVRGDSPGGPDNAAADQPGRLDNDPEDHLSDMRYRG